MKIINNIISYTFEKAKRSKLIQSLFEAPININMMPLMGVFTDSSGDRHPLYSGYRSKIKPGWGNMLKNTVNYISEPDYKKAAAEGRLNHQRLKNLIEIFNEETQSLKILEIGCHLGAVCYSIAETINSEITGTEFTEYKISALNKEIDPLKTNLVASQLNRQREELSNLFKLKGKVSFIDDDICNSLLPADTFDIIISFDVLEHLHQPSEAFKHIHRILKKDGVAIHEYNPFFSLNGGHSLCTLDFPWGHCRLNKTDFVRYIKEIRPEETGVAIPFYNEGLNRMTHYDLVEYTRLSGLQLAGFIKYSKEQHVRMLSKEITEKSGFLFPNLTVDDLVAPKVVVIQKKST